MPYITYDQVGQIVKGFLKEFHPSLELPIPIERIIEFGDNTYRLFLSLLRFAFPEFEGAHHCLVSSGSFFNMASSK